MTIAPGAIVRILRRGDVAYVVVRQDTFNPHRWRCTAVAIDSKDRIFHEGITAGEGDMVVVREAPIFSPGTQVRFNGGTAQVIADNGDTATVAIPPARFKTRAGDYLHVPPSRAVADKANLVLEELT